MDVGRRIQCCREWLTTTKNVDVNDRWLQSCVDWILPGVPGSKDLNTAVYEQWLHGDLMYSTIDSVDSDTDEFERGLLSKAQSSSIVIKKSLAVQVENFRDCSTSVYNQLTSARNIAVGKDQQCIATNVKDEVRMRRTLSLTLSNGRVKFKAVEMDRLECLKISNLHTGSKLLISGKLNVHLNVLMLRKANVNFLGGYIRNRPDNQRFLLNVLRHSCKAPKDHRNLKSIMVSLFPADRNNADFTAIKADLRNEGTRLENARNRKTVASDNDLCTSDSDLPNMLKQIDERSLHAEHTILPTPDHTCSLTTADYHEPLTSDGNCVELEQDISAIYDILNEDLINDDILNEDLRNDGILEGDSRNVGILNDGPRDDGILKEGLGYDCILDEKPTNDGMFNQQPRNDDVLNDDHINDDVLNEDLGNDGFLREDLGNDGILNDGLVIDDGKTAYHQCRLVNEELGNEDKEAHEHSKELSFLKNILGSGGRNRWFVRVFVVSITKPLYMSNGQWSLNCLVNDGTCAIECKLTSDVLDKLIGMTASDYKRLSAEERKRADDTEARDKRQTWLANLCEVVGIRRCDGDPSFQIDVVRDDWYC